MEARIAWVNGFVNLRTNGTNTQRKSLGIKIPKEKFHRFFNPDKQQFNKTANGSVLEEYETYNLTIKEALKKYAQAGENIEVLKGEKKSFLKYWQTHVIDTIPNHGTRIKNENVKSKLEKYLKSIHKSDLLFKDITTPFLRSLRHYMLKKPDPKTLSNNSANHYLKMISGVITQAEKDEYYTYFKNPFKPVDYNHEKVKKTILSQEEVYKLLNTEIPIHDKKHKRIDLSRDMLLFQVFANGMRVSDLLTLRWNNIKFDNSGTENRLMYTMIKTGSHVNIPLNKNLSYLLLKRMGFEEEASITLSYEANDYIAVYGHYVDLKATIRKNKKNDKYLKDLDTEKDEKITIEELLAISLKGKIKSLNKNSFIFPVLKDEEFKTIGSNNNFSIMTESQYKRIKHCTIVYDRALKDLADYCEIESKISSHVSRHSFTNLVLMLKDVNLYDLSQMLSHSSISITQNYIQDGFNIKKQDFLNRQLPNFIGKQSKDSEFVFPKKQK